MKREEKLNKFLLDAELILILTSIIWFLSTIIVAAYVMEIHFIVGLILFIIPVVCLIPTVIIFVKIEQLVGHYVCDKCGNKYIPTTKDMWMSLHLGRTRYLKCPKCGQKSWNKKTF